jgi:hypothetical protein
MATIIMNHAGKRTMRYARPLGTCIKYKYEMPITDKINSATKTKTKGCNLRFLEKNNATSMSGGSHTGARRARIRITKFPSVVLT